jgi:hypothetical protein
MIPDRLDAFFEHLKNRAHELASDYPWKGTEDAWEFLYAITATLEGTNAANEDLHHLLEQFRQEEQESHEIELRPFFAAHAPGVPEWFTHTPAPGKPNTGDMDSTGYHSARAAWSREDDAQRFFQWRWFYADRMIDAGRATAKGGE